MSRIHEALRRIESPDRMPSLDSLDKEQVAFAPAWSLHDPAAPPSSASAESSATPARRGNSRKLAVVSFASAWRQRLAAPPDGDPALIEQFRRLAASLHKARQTHALNSIMLTSASPGDGKTLSAVNLALVLADSYRYNVLLIDADLRRPSISDLADIADGYGLADVLRSPTEQKLALVPMTDRLTLLPAGRPVSNSIEALTSPRMQQILDEATQRFDWVILDAPPVGAAADARLLTEMVGGTLFVIHAGKTPHADVHRAIEGLGRQHLLGVILNGVNGAPEETYSYYGPPQGEGRG